MTPPPTWYDVQLRVEVLDELAPAALEDLAERLLRALQVDCAYDAHGPVVGVSTATTPPALEVEADVAGDALGDVQSKIATVVATIERTLSDVSTELATLHAERS
jgi:ethanolamine utilization microcompartment shell protein EutL